MYLSHPFDNGRRAQYSLPIPGDIPTRLSEESSLLLLGLGNPLQTLELGAYGCNTLPGKRFQRRAGCRIVHDCVHLVKSHPDFVNMGLDVTCCRLVTAKEEYNDPVAGLNCILICRKVGEGVFNRLCMLRQSEKQMSLAQR